MIVRRATLRLAVRYSLVMLGVIALFWLGVALYVSVAFDIELPEASASEEAIDRANSTLHTGLVICFAVLVLLVPLLSYLLARSALAPVRSSFEAQQRFVDDASHELRTPIAIAQGELELALMQPRTSKEYRDTIRGALEAVSELTELTNDLLLLARAIANLIENAVKFSPPGAPVWFSIGQADGLTRITVADQGVGMTATDTERAFERFWRAETARSTPGHGIGLSIVQRIAEYHGGNVALRSTPGKGTRAILDLPRYEPLEPR